MSLRRRIRGIIDRRVSMRPLAFAAVLAAAVTILAATLGLALYAGGRLLEDAWSLAEHRARLSASRIGQRMAETIVTSRAIAKAFEAIRATSASDRRIYDGFLLQVLKANPRLLSTWAAFEPNALDGRDEAYRGKPGTDATGRYLTVYDRPNGSIALDAVHGYDEPGSAERWYREPMNKRRESITDPYYYSYDGKPEHAVYTSTVSVPVFDVDAETGIPGRAIGVVGVDLGTSFLRDLIAEEGEWVSAIASSSGGWIIHPDVLLVGQPLGSGLDADIGGRVSRGEDWSGRAESPIDGRPSFIHLAPIRFEASGRSWTYITSLPISSISDRLSRIVLISVIASVAAAMATGLLMMRVIGAEKRLGASEALREANERLAEAGRWEVFNRVASAVAHEINTPIAVMSSSARMLGTFAERFALGAAAIYARAPEEEGRIFSGLLERARKHPALLSGLDRLDARETLARSLAEAGAREAARIADDLVDAGIVEADGQAAPLLAGPLGPAAAEALCAAATLQREADLMAVASARASRYVRAVRDFIPDSAKEPFAELDVAETIAAALDLVREPFGQGLLGSTPIIQDERVARGITLSARRQDLVRLWSILLSNAVYAAGPGGTVTVNARGDRAFAAVSIADSGPGIDPKVRERIFEPFVTTKGRGEGIGLGLSIARKIALEHGGDIGFESAPGRTEFTVRLPRGGAGFPPSAGGAIPGSSPETIRR